MWDALTWPELRNAQVRDTVEQLREQTLHLVLAVTTVGYLIWQYATTFLAPHQDAPRSWVVFPAVAVSLVTVHVLVRQGSRVAAPFLLGSAVVLITVAAWLLDAPAAMGLYPIVVMVAVVLVNPLAGLVVTAGVLGLLLVLASTGQVAGVSAASLVETTILSLVTIAAASVLGRDMLITTQWWLGSYEEAMRQAREAQEHRAQVVRAMGQLNTAYYRLQQANVALEVAWRAAEAAEHSKTEFVTNISHELRTPLNLIIGFSEMILGAPESYGVPLPPSYRIDLNAVYRSAQHLLALTNDVIDLARIGSERLALDPEPVELGQTIEDACDLVREYVALKGLQLRVEVPSGLPTLIVDRLRIRQVLLNLLTNATRFTERGSITVSATQQDGSITVRVSDTGRGISAEMLPRVFEEFYSDHAMVRSTERFGGAGLGLPISRRLVELHGGQMGVESTLGEGTAFWFTLPVGVVLSAAQPASIGLGRQNGPTWGSELPTLERRSLVLVSENDRLARFIQRYLRGYSVSASADLTQALASAQETHAAGILVDASVPESEIAEAEARVETTVPILRLPLPQGQRVALALEATAYLDKPVTQTELAAALATLGRPVRSVLIIDDDASFAHLVERMLRVALSGQELSVLSGRSGREGLTILQQELPPDLVILDLVMPELGGQETLAAIRDDPRLAEMPVMIISAQSQLEAQFRLCGSLSVRRRDGFQLDELLGAVEALLVHLGRLGTA